MAATRSSNWPVSKEQLLECFMVNFPEGKCLDAWLSFFIHIDGNKGASFAIMSHCLGMLESLCKVVENCLCKQSTMRDAMEMFIKLRPTTVKQKNSISNLPEWAWKVRLVLGWVRRMAKNPEQWQGLRQRVGGDNPYCIRLQALIDGVVLDEPAHSLAKVDSEDSQMLAVECDESCPLASDKMPDHNVELEEDEVMEKPDVQEHHLALALKAPTNAFWMSILKPLHLAREDVPPLPTGHQAISKAMRANQVVNQASKAKKKQKAKAKKKQKATATTVEVKKKESKPVVKEPAELKMEAKNVYSRAYHQALCKGKRDGLEEDLAKSKAREAGNAAKVQAGLA